MRQAAKNPALIGVGLVLLSIISVQFGAAAAKGAFGQIDAIGIVTLRLVFAALVMVLIARPAFWRWDARQWRAVVMLGVLLAVMNGLFYLSLASIPVGVAVTLEMIGPLTVAIAQTRRWRDALWVLLAVVGIVFLGVRAWGGALDPVGMVLALGAGAAWGGYIIATRNLGAAIPGLSGLAGAMMVGALVLVPFGAVSAVSASIAHPEVLLIGLMVALCSSVLAYGFELSALRRIGTREFGVLMSLEPAAAALMGLVILGEHLALTELAAIALVAVASAGVAFTAARAGRSRPETEAATGEISVQRSGVPPLP